MNTKIVLALVAIVLVGALAWFALSPNPAAAPTDGALEENTASSTETVNEEDTSAVTTITLTDSGFSPSSVTISVGQTVRFVNNSSRGMWVGADEHPTHTEYDGTSTREHCADGANTTGSFDQCTSAPAGASWDYTFLKSGTFGYHNHVGASNTGTVIVR